MPRKYEEHVGLMFDVLTLAFQTDSTRISSFIMAHDGSNRPYPQIGVSEGHHDLSHHGGDKLKKEKITKINRFHLEQFARFLEVECADDYYESLDMESVLQPQSLLCYEMYGQPLDRGHGARVPSKEALRHVSQ